MKNLFFTALVTCLFITLSSMTSPVVVENDKPEMPFPEYLVKRSILYQSNEELETQTGRRFNFMERLSLSIQRKKIEREFRKSNHLQDCDAIVMKNGDEIKAIITEVGVSDIKYKRCDNKTGPVHTMSKSGVFMIRYANGTKDVINEQTGSGSNTSNTSGTGEVKTDAFAIVSIAAGVTGAVLFFTGFGGILLGIAGIVFGFVSKGRIKKSNGKLKGKGLANAGIITGIVVVGLSILAIALWVSL